MTTFVQLKTLVSRDLRDESNQVFDLNTVGDIINVALGEIGRIAPDRFQENITPVANSLSYIISSAQFGGITVPEIELIAVEIWDGSVTPMTQVSHLQPAAAQFASDTQSGWRVWNGRLELPNAVEAFIDPAIHLIRVWGYRPYPELVNDGDVVPTSAELTQALREVCYIASLKRLVGSRVLFTQWQTRTNNTDVSPGSLMTDLNEAEASWRQKSRALFVIREAPG